MQAREAKLKQKEFARRIWGSPNESLKAQVALEIWNSREKVNLAYFTSLLSIGTFLAGLAGWRQDTKSLRNRSGSFPVKSIC